MARIGTSGTSEFVLMRARGSVIVEAASVSFVPLDRSTLSTVGACHQRRWSVPPSPRFVVRGVPYGEAPVCGAVVLIAAVVGAPTALAAAPIVGTTLAAVVPVVVEGFAVAALVAGAVVLAGAAVFVATLSPPHAARTSGNRKAADRRRAGR